MKTTVELSRHVLGIVQKQLERPSDEEYEPYFGWCDVKGCDNEASSSGVHWKETGYWLICTQHGDDARGGKFCPTMKKKSIKREKSRDPKTGYLP